MWWHPCSTAGWRWPNRFYRPLEQRVLAASRAVVTTSHYLDASPALAPWRERCHVIPLGLDPNRIPDPRSGGRWRGRKHCGAIGDLGCWPSAG